MRSDVKNRPVGTLAALALVIPWVASLVGVSVEPNIGYSIALLLLTVVSYFTPRNV